MDADVAPALGRSMPREQVVGGQAREAGRAQAVALAGERANWQDKSRRSSAKQNEGGRKRGARPAGGRTRRV
jgi:hypothetical protein